MNATFVGQFGRRVLNAAGLCALCGCLNSNLLAAAPEPVDFNRAQQLLHKSKQGEKLSPEDQAYLDRAKAARRGGQGGKAAKGGENGKAADDSSPDRSTQREVFAKAADGTPLHWDVYQPHGSGPWPAVLLIHGGGFIKGNENIQQLIAAAHALNAIGYIGFSVEYRLAPPGHINGQKSQGYYPEQTDDVKLAILKARTDPRCNGKVGALGGSAGGHHAAFIAADGKDGADKVDVAVCLSGAYDFSDEKSLNHKGQFKSKVQNYAHSTDKAVLLASSPISKVTASASPMLLVETENDSMPPNQMLVMEAKLKSLGVTNYKTIMLPGGGHSFANWPKVKDQCIAFLNSVLKDSNAPPSLAPR